jgi:hypothetical protein
MDWKNSRSVGSQACSSHRRSYPGLSIEPIAERLSTWYYLN